MTEVGGRGRKRPTPNAQHPTSNGEVSAEEFGDGFDRFDVGAEDFERGQDRDGEDDAGNAPHPTPEMAEGTKKLKS
jgi:hypothetical protein